MCGIAGIVSPPEQTPDPVALERMATALGHRGPDGQCQRVTGTVGLVHVRLAIIDLTGGQQPILDSSGRAIVANGEIYNYPELRSALPEVTFTTASDCEPPLALYAKALCAKEGEDFTHHLRGMYALAIHDPQRNRVTLSRDPFGIKPLYLAEGPWGVAFASEAQALIASGLVAPVMDLKRRAELLQLQFTCGTQTPFVGIRRLAPGETVVIEAGRLVSRQRRPAFPVLEEGGKRATPEALLDQLDALLQEAVTLHQRSDVPYGMFLSGGIDSSALLAMMARINPSPVLAFTAGFPARGVHDERDHARALAASVGARHVDVSFGSDDFWDLLPKVAAAMDDPVADYATLPTFKLAERARQEVKVILSGEGGDEVFGGYGRYRGAMRPWPFTKIMRRHGTFDGLGVLRPSVLAGWRDGMESAAFEAKQHPHRSRLQVAQAVDCADWLPNDLLLKLDRCLMANGVEGRVPFLDQKLATFAFGLPDGSKIKNGMGKHLLRLWLDKAMPAAQAFSKKRGFTVPVAEWIAARRSIGSLVARQPGIQEIAAPSEVERLFASCTPKTGFACWTLLFYALWHQRHVRGLVSGGDAFACLEG